VTALLAAGAAFLVDRDDGRQLRFPQQADVTPAEATTAFEEADDLRRSADIFTLFGVFLASALFRYGIAGVSRARKVRPGLTGVGFVINVGAVTALLGMSV